MKCTLLSLGLLAMVSLAGCAQVTSTTSTTPSGEPLRLTVNVDQPGARINPAMWGIFFEDINLGADGGLYAEMVKNRGFEFPEPLMGWSKISPSNARGDVTVMSENPNNPHYIRIRSTANPPLGVSNEGFRGMGVKAGESYDFSAQVRGIEGSPRVTVELVAEDGTTLAAQPLTGISSNWRKITTTLVPRETNANARLTVIVEGPGAVDFDMISLFPQKTWKNRPGGLRADMVQLLADLKPGFLRFPGGCIVEGSDLTKRYQWKNTIGPIEDRPLLINRWNYEFKHRPAPDYFQTFGLGFFEYFQLAEDIGAEPLPILNCGMACQFNSGELVPLDQLGPYIQDALDLIEFANGPTTSTWGARRAAMGHPEPFNMKMIGVGNEQWGPQYIERLEIFTRALKEKHPEIAIVSGAGPSPDDERYTFLWPRLAELKADIVDEHCYANPIWFFANSDRYDTYDRNGPKVFFGEYGAQSIAIVSPRNRNNFGCALSEAAFLTGVERNADVVRMASYAPLFAHEQGWQWTPDLIWTNNLDVRATPNYHVQKLFSTNRGDVVLPIKNNAPIKEILPKGRIAIGTSQASAEFRDVRVAKNGQTLLSSSFSSTTDGWFASDQWRTVDGAYQQPNPGATVSAYTGETGWSDYTLTLRARKLGGDGGLIITVLDDGAGSYAQWRIGGWGNQQHGILTHYAQQDQLLERVPGSIQTNRWYDIKIVLNGSQMQCYLENQLIQQAEVLRHRIPTLFVSATRDDATGETILKVVNPENQPQRVMIHLSGTRNVAPTARATILTGKLDAENTFDDKDNVVPITETITGIRPEFAHTFKPHSLTVLRIETASGSE